jgi:hypothetical protein
MNIKPFLSSKFTTIIYKLNSTITSKLILLINILSYLALIYYIIVIEIIDINIGIIESIEQILEYLKNLELAFKSNLTNTLLNNYVKIIIILLSSILQSDYIKILELDIEGLNLENEKELSYTTTTVIDLPEQTKLEYELADVERTTIETVTNIDSESCLNNVGKTKYILLVVGILIVVVLGIYYYTGMSPDNTSTSIIDNASSIPSIASSNTSSTITTPSSVSTVVGLVGPESPMTLISPTNTAVSSFASTTPITSRSTDLIPYISPNNLLGININNLPVPHQIGTSEILNLLQSRARSLSNTPTVSNILTLSNISGITNVTVLPDTLNIISKLGNYSVQNRVNIINGIGPYPLMISKVLTSFSPDLMTFPELFNTERNLTRIVNELSNRELIQLINHLNHNL